MERESGQMYMQCFHWCYKAPRMESNDSLDESLDCETQQYNIYIYNALSHSVHAMNLLWPFDKMNVSIRGSQPVISIYM